MEPRDEPRPDEGADAQGHQQVREIAGHDRSEEAERGDRPDDE